MIQWYSQWSNDSITLFGLNNNHYNRTYRIRNPNPNRTIKFTHDDDDDEIAYFTMRWKTKKLVLSTAPKPWNNTDKDSKTEKWSH